MPSPVIWVTASLTTAIVVTTSLLIATASRGNEAVSTVGPLEVQTIARGLAKPWSLAFLPDGRMLVTEKAGRLRIVSRDGKIAPPVKGVPDVAASGQGGMLDVITDRNFASSNTIFFCFAEKSGAGSHTAVARATLVGGDDARLDNTAVIFRQQGPASSGNHHGCRIVQAPDGNLFVTLGDHFSHRDEAQNLRNHLGKLIRITPDGKAPPDNPFVGRSDAAPEIWSYGHRNQQGLAINPVTGELWETEHGPRGGDEVNLIVKGKNYGWPVIGYGVDYSGAKIHQATARAGMEQPLKYWVPSIAPSGLTFYTGALFPQWRGSLFSGALAGQMLVRLQFDGAVTREERLLTNFGERIRDVRQGPDGALWLLTDSSNGRILRVAPPNT